MCPSAPTTPDLNLSSDVKIFVTKKDWDQVSSRSWMVLVCLDQRPLICFINKLYIEVKRKSVKSLGFLRLAATSTYR